MEIKEQHQQARASFRAFADEEIVPYADSFDRQERIPVELIEKLARKNYLGAAIPEQFGGLGLDLISYGFLHEELGRACSSVRSLVTVHCMTAQAILKWGSREQKESWLPKMAAGQALAGFALSEPGVGSDAASVETTASADGDYYTLNGTKKWITFGQIANFFLVIARCERNPIAILVDADTPGLTREPINGMLGVRASMLAALNLADCRAHKRNVIAKPGFGFAPVATTVLEHGRYCVAWGCVGIAQACLEACAKYVKQRKQFGSYLKDFQLIQQMITKMVCDISAARALCIQAGHAKSANDPAAFTQINIAKYFASLAASRCAADAVQIHGALGCSPDSSVQRYFRDAKIMEIIEGSTQIQEFTIANSFLRDFV